MERRFGVGLGAVGGSPCLTVGGVVERRRRWLQRDMRGIRRTMVGGEGN